MNTDDYIALYLDSNPIDNERSSTQHQPVFYLSLNETNGIVTTNYYLPMIDFYNETTNLYKSRLSDSEKSSLRSAKYERIGVDLNEIAIDEQNVSPSLTGVAKKSSKLVKINPNINENAKHSKLIDTYNDNWNNRQPNWATYMPTTTSTRKPPNNFKESSEESQLFNEYHAFRSGHWNNDNSYVSHQQTSRRLSTPQTTTSKNIQNDDYKLKYDCIGYCIAYHNGVGFGNKILASSCLRAYPNWMSELYSKIESRSITQLMLPGTHNSGTYMHMPINSGIVDKSALALINKYQVNQDESVFNQLVYGVRLLDLRVGYAEVVGHSDVFWIYHDILRTETPVREVLAQVKLFLDLTENEIIILDFHRFPVGFDESSVKKHSLLIELMFNSLGSYIVPSYLGLNGPISEYVSAGKRLIVCYAERQAAPILTSFPSLIVASEERKLSLVKDVDEIERDTNNDDTDKTRQHIENTHQKQMRASLLSSLLFQPVRHLWPNKDSLTGLEEYLNSSACSHYYGELRSLMVELTPTLFGALIDKYDGTRRLASQVSRPITDWLRDRWLHCLNSVSSDFFLANNLINLSLYANKVRYYQRTGLRGCSDQSSSSGGCTIGDINSPLAATSKCQAMRKVGHLLDPMRFASNSNGQSRFPEPPSKRQPQTYPNTDRQQEDNAARRVWNEPAISRPFISSTAPIQTTSFVDEVSDKVSSLVWSIRRLFNNKK